MALIRIAAGLLALGISAGASAVPLLNEGFDDVAALASSGWVFTNSSTPVGQSWFQGNSGIFAAASGAEDAYAAVNFNSSTSATGAIDNWLISPELAVGSGASLSFATRAADEGFLDRIEILFSSGSGTDLAGFSTVLAVGSASSAAYPTAGWQQFTLNLPDASSGRFAFRYTVANAMDASYVGIDSVMVTAVPEPASMLMLGLGLAVVAGARRRKAVAHSQQACV